MTSSASARFGQRLRIGLIERNACGPPASPGMVRGPVGIGDQIAAMLAKDPGALQGNDGCQRAAVHGRQVIQQALL
jgi:hypothetical protein